MIADDQILAQVAAADPAADWPAGVEADRAQAQRILARVLAEPSPPARKRRGVGLVLPALGVLVALVVIAAIVRLGATGTGSPTVGATGTDSPTVGATGTDSPTVGATGTGSSTGAATELKVVFRAQPTPQVPAVTPDALAREAQILRARLRTVASDFHVTRAGGDRLAVVVHGRAAADRTQTIDLLSRSDQLYFYDWEANVLTPNGRTVASQLLSHSAAAVRVSQGINGGPGAGVPGAGGMPLYQAVKLASTRPVAPPSKFQSRKGPEYYMFGAPGSAACAAAAKAFGVTVVPGRRCLLARPASSVKQLDAGLPPGVSASEGQVLKVPQGTVVLQAASISAADKVSFYSPDVQFYVLKDDVSLTGNDITNPREGTDAGGNPDVQFGLNGAGRAKFQRVTAAIAHRGQNVSLVGQTLAQHFAVALNNQLVTVPQIDFHAYPDGIIGIRAADITGGLTRGSARALARELRLGALPLELQVVRPIG